MTVIQSNLSHGHQAGIAWRSGNDGTLVLAVAWALTIWLYYGEEEASFTLRHGNLECKLSVPIDTAQPLHSLFEWVAKKLSGPANSFQTGDGDPASVLHVYQCSQTPTHPVGKTSIHVFCRTGDDKLSAEIRDATSTVASCQYQHLQRCFLHLAGCLSQVSRNDPVHRVVSSYSDDIGQVEEGTEIDIPPVMACIHDLVSQRCQKRPNAIAVDAWDGQLSYEELDQLSVSLAQQLVHLGVGRGDVVCVCTEKSCWFTVAILAVMKSGASFAAFDASQPLERLRAIRDKVQANVVLTSVGHRSLAASLGDDMAVVEMGWKQSWTTDPPSRLEHLPIVKPTDVAYIAFTSGSTGTPKGAVIQHASFCTGALAHGPAYQIASGSRVFQFSSYAFDGSIMDNLTTLIHGGTVCVPSEEGRTSNLAGVITQSQSTVLCTTPSILRTLRPQAVPTLETVILTGELAAQEDMRTWADHVQLILTYGPTECSVSCSATGPLKPDSDPRNVGQPYACATWFVHPWDNSILTPPGGIGELCLDGPIVGQGYRNQPEQTAIAFWKDPSWLPNRGGHGVVYRTGDLMRRLPDGSLYFLGRKDAQVKIRGQRVELGEIEHHLCQAWPGPTCNVIAGMVRVQPDQSLSILAGFIMETANSHKASTDRPSFLVPDRAFRDATQQAMQHFQAHLPTYMIPSVILPMAYFPMTSSGKIDRRRLQEQVAMMSPADIRPYRLVQHQQLPELAGSTFPQEEQTLLDIVRRVLGQGSAGSVVGRSDNLLDLGLDSLMAMQLASRARDASLNLTVENIFTHPTVARLAVVASTHHGHDRSPPSERIIPFALIPQAEQIIAETFHQHGLHRNDVDDLYPCTGNQAWMAHISGTGSDNMTSTWLAQLPPIVDVDELARAWATVGGLQSILRTHIIQVAGRGPMQLVSRRPPSVEIVAVSPASPVPVPPDYNIWGYGKPLVRIILIPAGEPHGSPRCIVAIHHVIHDGYSLPLLFRQVDAIYRGAQPKPQLFGRFIHHVCQLQPKVQSMTVAAFQGWSKRHIFPPLPHEGFEPWQNTALEHAATLPSGGGNRSDLPSSAIMQLALAVLISLRQGTTDVAFGVVDSGRGATISGLHDMVGPTVGMRPVRIRLAPFQSIRDALDQIHLQGLEMLPYPFCGLAGIEAASWVPSLNTALLIDVDSTKMSFSGLFEHTEALKGEVSWCDVPFGLLCHVGLSNIRLRAQFDRRVLPEEEMRAMLHQLGVIIEKIYSSIDGTLEDLKSVA
ncbi:hypothetical protein BJX76DRAFT_359402 [Aspergillus varians]